MPLEENQCGCPGEKCDESIHVQGGPAASICKVQDPTRNNLTEARVSANTAFVDVTLKRFHNRSVEFVTSIGQPFNEDNLKGIRGTATVQRIIFSSSASKMGLYYEVWQHLPQGLNHP